MKRMLPLFMLVCASLAHADWTRLDSSPKDPVLYKDDGPVEKSGPDTFKAWHVVDYAADQDHEGKPYRSVKLNYHYDCGKQMMSEMLQVKHRDPMGSGMTVFWTHGPWPWFKPEAGSVELALLTAMCKQ